MGRTTATVPLLDMAEIPSSETSSRWLMARAPWAAPAWKDRMKELVNDEMNEEINEEMNDDGKLRE